MTAAGRSTASPAPRHAAAPARRRAIQRPGPGVARRLSGPVTGRARPEIDRPVSGVGARLLLVVRSLPDNSLLDRIVRGRAWIPLLGVLLAGIVATQVEVLRLNASMGRALKQTSSLAVRNQALRASVAELSDDARITRLAARMGMVIPGPTTLSFVPANASVVRAIAGIHAPAASQFVAQLPSSSSGDSSASSSTASADTSSGADSGGGNTSGSSSSAGGDTSGNGGSSASGDTSSGGSSATGDASSSSSSSGGDTSGGSSSGGGDSSGGASSSSSSGSSSGG